MRYFIVTYITKANGKIDEATAVSQRVRPRDIQTASVILDFKTQTVEKCVINGETADKDWNRIVSYYYQHYPSTLERMFAENGHVLNNQNTNNEKQDNPN